jgi:hypothetical protein
LGLSGILKPVRVIEATSTKYFEDEDSGSTELAEVLPDIAFDNLANPWPE